MNLFEDLVEELKEDNLLEDTIIDAVKLERSKQSLREVSEVAEQKEEVSEVAEQKDIVFPEKSSTDHTEFIEEELAGDPQTTENDETNSESEVETVDSSDLPEDEDVKKSGNSEREKDDAEPFVEEEFYRRRALDEVNGLEMVEHVISGVEREMMNTAPVQYDDFAVKSALHEFLKVAEDVNSPEHSKAEFSLMQETENWHTVLSERDQRISVEHLRRYCETTKPSLSSQALISLAKFYRNAPFTEEVRSKFDLVITKVFTKEIGNEKRKHLFKPEELILHIQDLYADWSSVPLYSVDNEDSDLLIHALKFQDFIHEAEVAESIDELFQRDFFKELKAFKEETSENFFSPMLVSAAIESNVSIGNRYVELLELEKSKGENIIDKYGNNPDNSISEATSKTIQILEILKEKKEEAEEKNSQEAFVPGKTRSKTKTKKKKSKKKGLFSANRKLVVATIITIIFGAIYFLIGGPKNTLIGTAKTSKSVKIVNLDNSSLKDYVHSARINRGTLFAISNEKWDQTSFNEKQEIIQKFLSTGEDKEFSKVHLLNSDGATVAFGSPDGINVLK
jgi:hypothetical protein